MNEKILAACVAFSCAPVLSQAPPAPCVTRCGLQAPGNCADLQVVEHRVVKVFGALGWGGPQEVCQALEGWTVRRHLMRPSDGVACGKGAWALSAGFCVRGYTHVGAREIELPDMDWASSVLPHELVHVLDVTHLGKAGHCGWEARGIKAALLEIQSRPDESEPESTCP